MALMRIAAASSVPTLLKNVEKVPWSYCFRRANRIYEDVDVLAGVGEASMRTSIEGYSETGFLTNDGINHEGSIICLSKFTLLWTPKTVPEITPNSLTLFQLLRPAPEILILGCGRTIQPVSKDVKDFLRSNGIKLEFIDTRNAASTFNFLNEEGRLVAAALLPQGAQ
ncbi:hypothetical protein O6H91_21G038700 [Diphasiastrum complanatum]|uniref:Uncharacterized protein n=1 Tax=Diphasiastrum complanatum TaxID=34168 RepID=A0ACC2AJK7_DIPCM|nr:hypothetical protein O6H91_21G038700 [Diphasiastrum complanatum]